MLHHHPTTSSSSVNHVGGTLLFRHKVSVVAGQQQRNIQQTDRKRTNYTTLPSDWELGNWTIFYNIFIPQTNPNVAFDILHEQLDQISSSDALKFGPVTLYYTVIGNFEALPEMKMQQMCHAASPNLHCTLSQTSRTGSERKTLELLHSFCQTNAPDYRVTYLHSKGSFHASEKNTNWRRLLTAAAVHPNCIVPPNSTCNLCGLQFFTQFTFFVPGNMWTASCRYVAQLLPFDLYYDARERAVEQLLILKLQNQLRGTLLWDQLDFLGLDRYSDEHWVGSHPSIVPCDMDPYGSVKDVFHGILQQDELEWAAGPRNRGICGGINDNLQDAVKNNPDLRRREVLLLPGLIVKWYTLYGKLPDRSSWVWTFFPDGQYWFEGARKYGSDVVDTYTARYRTSLDGSRLITAFAPNPYDIVDSNFTKDSSSKIAIFYHLAIPNGFDGSAIVGDNSEWQETVIMAEKQMKLLQTSYAASEGPVPFFFTVAGGATRPAGMPDLADFVMNMCKSIPTLKCSLLQQLKQNFEGETIRSLHQFCKANPSYRVSYIHNQAPVQLRLEGGNENLILHMTLAVTSKLCLDPEPSSPCNVCGLIFYTMWTFFFPGNMFAATCEYINKLLPPDSYEEAMSSFVGKMLLRRVRAQITSNLFHDRMDYFGYGRYAIDHWVGSHPSLVPCDLSAPHPFEFWRETTIRSVPLFNFSVAPRQYDAPFDLRSSKRDRILDDAKGQERREYFYLLGPLLRWITLYNETPQPQSWVWWNVPDGLVWLKGTYNYGLNVVDALTAEYARDTF
jgi:hypothetical protein